MLTAIDMATEINELVQSMSREVRDNLATAVEIGKWPDGVALTQEQRENAMQAVMLWDSQHGQEENEPFKVLKGGKLIRQMDKQPESTEQHSSDKHDESINIKIRD